MVAYSDRRRYPRLASQLSVKYKLVDQPDDDFVREITNSIGQGGCFIRTKRPHPMKSKLDIILELRNRHITMQGEVRYVIPYDDEAKGVQFPGMGIQFLIIPNDDQEFIGKFVEEGLKKSRKS